MKCHLRFATVVLAAAALAATASATAEADPDPDPNPESKPPKLPPSDSLLFEHRSAKPEPFLDRLASALFGTRYVAVATVVSLVVVLCEIGCIIALCAISRYSVLPAMLTKLIEASILLQERGCVNGQRETKPMIYGISSFL